MARVTQISLAPDEGSGVLTVLRTKTSVQRICVTVVQVKLYVYAKPDTKGLILQPSMMSSTEGALCFESQRNSCFLSNALWHSGIQQIPKWCCLAGLPPIDEAFLDITNPNEAFALLSERSLHLLDPPTSQAAGPQPSQAQVSPNGGLPPLHNYLNDRCTHGAHTSALDALFHLMHLCT